MSNPIILLLVNIRSVQLRRNLIPMNKDPRFRLEKPVDIFQTPICGLWVEEKGNRNKTRANHRPNNPESPSQVRNPTRCDLRDHIIHNPIRGHSQGRSFRSHLKGVDLSRVQPRNAEDAHSEGGKEYEEEGNGDCAIVVGASWVFHG